MQALDQIDLECLDACTMVQDQGCKIRLSFNGTRIERRGFSLRLVSVGLFFSQ
jgi:hypothetical protein